MYPECPADNDVNVLHIAEVTRDAPMVWHLGPLPGYSYGQSIRWTLNFRMLHPQTPNFIERVSNSGIQSVASRGGGGGGGPLRVTPSQGVTPRGKNNKSCG